MKHDDGLRLVLVEGAPELRKKARPVHGGHDVALLEKCLRATCEAAGGLGLSAPQIGVSLRAALANGIFFVNLERYPLGARRRLATEGCLSLPGVSVDVSRWSEVSAAGWGCRHEFKWLQAAVVQHEYDHLDGVLITDRGLRRGAAGWRSPWQPVKPERPGDELLVFCPGCGHAYPWRRRLDRVQAMCFSAPCMKATRDSGTLLDVLGWRPW